MYTVDPLPPVADDPPPPAELPAPDSGPASEDELDEGPLAYTSYSVAGYTTPRICTDEVRTCETTGAVVAVGGGAAVSAASCWGDFTKEAPIRPPTASRAAAMPTPSSTRRRRASRDPRTEGRPLSSGSLWLAGEPSRITRSSDCFAPAQGAGRGRNTPEPRYWQPSTVVLRPPHDLCVSLMSTPPRGPSAVCPGCRGQRSHETFRFLAHDVYRLMLR